MNRINIPQSNPKISCLMTVFNGEKFVREAVESIVNQTLQDFELIIVEDGSTDNTLAIIESFDDQRIRIVRNEKNKGISYSKNRGISCAKGKYVAIMDADDISFPERFEKQYKFMEENPQIGVCGTAKEEFGARFRIIHLFTRHEDIFTGLLFGCTFVHPSVFIRKSSIQNINAIYDPSYDTAEDYEYWIRLGFAGVKFANLKDVLIKYRIHEHNIGVVSRVSQKRKGSELRISLLKKLGIVNPQTKIEIHDLFRQPGSLGKSEILLAEKWMNEMLEANAKTSLFCQRTLRKQIAENWFRVCLKSYRNGFWSWRAYHQHPISKQHQLGLKKQLKLLLQCLIRREIRIHRG